MDEKLPKKDETLFVSLYERWMKNYQRKIKDCVLVLFCGRWMKKYQRKMKDGGSKIKHCVCLVCGRWTEKLPKKDETLCVSLC